jgi:OmpR family response regulator RpaB
MTAHRYLLISERNSFAQALVSSAIELDDELKVVQNPTEAIAHIERTKPDAVLWELDAMDREGVVACHNLRRHADVPIVMLVNPSATEQIVRGYRLGADAYLPIPFDRREFTARIQALLRRLAHSV